MSERMTLATFIDLHRKARAEWEAALNEVDARQMEQPGVVGPWSVKDVIAHIAWHDREMVHMIAERSHDGSELWNLPLDERNAAIYEENRLRSLEEVREEADELFSRLMQALQTLSDEALYDPRHFDGMPPDWEPQEVIAGNTYVHYQDHAAGLREWLESQGRDRAGSG